MFDRLFAPVTVRGLTLKNRVVLPAMGTRMASESSEVTRRLADYHAARAAGGCGLNMVEVSSVHTPSAPAHFVSISEDRFIPGHKMLTDAIHAAGGKAGVQLWQGSIAVCMDPKAQVLVASDLPFGQYTIPGISAEGIREVVDCYGRAARRAVAAGYDTLEFHCAHNYLPHSFLSGGLNHRTDAYGGSFENRARFPLECIRAIRANIPAEMPLFMRIDAQDDYLPGGLTVEEVIAFCKLAGQAGVDVLDISRGNIITPASVYEVPPIDVPNGFNVENAARIRRETGMLTMAVGRINTAQLAEEILEADKADLIVMGRAQLADPEFCNKAKSGRVQDIVHCVGCNQGCYDGFCDVLNRPFITCMRNPALGHEQEWSLAPAQTPKRVLIAGGGMAGMEAAKILAARGHKPEIYEKTSELGGQFILAGKAPGKAEMERAARSFGEQTGRAVPVHYGAAVTPELLRAEKPDAVVLAIGAEPIWLELPGAEQKPVFDSHAVLAGKAEPCGAVGVIGGGLVGLEVADYLAEKGHAVQVLEMRDTIGADLGSLRKIAVLQKLQRDAIALIPNAVCTAITPDGILTEQGGEEKTVACDSVVMAVGARPRKAETAALQAVCAELGIPCFVAGDAKQARRALDAVAEGFAAAREI